MLNRMQILFWSWVSGTQPSFQLINNSFGYQIQQHLENDVIVIRFQHQFLNFKTVLPYDDQHGYSKIGSYLTTPFIMLRSFTYCTVFFACDFLLHVKLQIQSIVCSLGICSGGICLQIRLETYLLLRFMMYLQINIDTFDTSITRPIQTI